MKQHFIYNETIKSKDLYFNCTWIFPNQIYIFKAYPTTAAGTYGIYIKGAYTYDTTAPYSYYSCLQNDLATANFGYLNQTSE